VSRAVDETPTGGDRQPTRNIEADLNTAGADVGELRRAVRLVSQQLHWLMDNALITADAPICDLDADVDEAMVALAATVERGEGFRNQLLDGATRNELRLAVDRHVDWRHRLEEQYAALVALSEAVVADDQQAALRAAEEFPAAKQAMRDLEKDGPRLEAAATRAAPRLQADEEMRREHRADIDAVAAAWQQLYRGLRAVIGEGVAKHALFPPWFRNSLGLAPPPDQPTRWFELATEIRAYRITYGVVTDDSALGAPPPEDSSTRRRDWYRRLSAGLARLT
jgi:hypothetical protein